MTNLQTLNAELLALFQIDCNAGFFAADQYNISDFVSGHEFEAFFYNYQILVVFPFCDFYVAAWSGCVDCLLN
jgi:hypothetical protein